MLQSRVPTAWTRPFTSAMTCTSTWRASGAKASTSSVASPKAARASWAALAKAPASSSAARTMRMPRPPPPAAALSSTG